MRGSFVINLYAALLAAVVNGCGSPDPASDDAGATDTDTDAYTCNDGPWFAKSIGDCQDPPSLLDPDPPVVEEIQIGLHWLELQCDNSSDLKCASDVYSYAIVVSGESGLEAVITKIKEVNPEFGSLDVDFLTQRVVIFGGSYMYCGYHTPEIEVGYQTYMWPDGRLHFAGHVLVTGDYDPGLEGFIYSPGILLVIDTDIDPTVCMWQF